MVGWRGWGLVARYRRARRRRVERERRIGARLAIWATRRPRPASEAEHVQFLAEIEDVPY